MAREFRFGKCSIDVVCHVDYSEPSLHYFEGAICRILRFRMGLASVRAFVRRQYAEADFRRVIVNVSVILKSADLEKQQHISRTA